MAGKEGRRPSEDWSLSDAAPDHLNTGRLYTVQGQIITALWDRGAQLVHFRDHSRMINGTIKGPDVEWRSNIPEMIARYVMILYDRYDYEMTVESLALERDPDAMIHEFRL